MPGRSRPVAIACRRRERLRGECEAAQEVKWAVDGLAGFPGATETVYSRTGPTGWKSALA